MLDVSQITSYKITLICLSVCRSVLSPSITKFSQDSWPKSGPKLDFLPFFFEFGSYVFLEIAYNDSLQQCLTSSRCKSHPPNLSQNWAQN